MITIMIIIMVITKLLLHLYIIYIFIYLFTNHRQCDFPGLAGQVGLLWADFVGAKKKTWQWKIPHLVR